MELFGAMKLPSVVQHQDALRSISASCEGYLQILKFYFSDAMLYSSGVIGLVQNIAIFATHDVSKSCVHNAFAVSGEHGSLAASMNMVANTLQAVEAPGEFDYLCHRCHDTELILLSGLCPSVSDVRGWLLLAE